MQTFSAASSLSFQVSEKGIITGLWSPLVRLVVNLRKENIDIYLINIQHRLSGTICKVNLTHLIDIQIYQSLMKLIPNYRLLEPLRTALVALRTIRNTTNSAHTREELAQPINKLTQVYQQLHDTINRSSQFYKKIEQDWMLLGFLRPKQPSFQGSSEGDADQACWLQQFIQISIARSKLSRLGIVCSRDDIQRIVPEVVTLQELAQEIQQRHQNYIQIIKIQKILSAIQQLYGHNSTRPQPTLKAISKRFQTLLQSINQSQHYLKTKCNTVPLSQYLKNHQQTLLLIRLITEANDVLLQQLLESVQNDELHRAIAKAVSQIRLRHEQLQILYHQLLENSALEKVELLCRFPRAVQQLNIDRKIKQCVKLLHSGSIKPYLISSLQASHRQSPQSHNNINEFLKNPCQQHLADIESSYNLRLLQKQQHIYSLQQEISSLTENLRSANSSITFFQQKISALNHELAEAYAASERQAIFYKQLKQISEREMLEYKQQIQINSKRQIALSDQCRRQLLEKNSQINELINELQKTEQNCKQLHEQKEAITMQLDALKLQDLSSRYNNQLLRRKVLQLQDQVRTNQQQQKSKSYKLLVLSTQSQTDSSTEYTPNLIIGANLFSYNICPSKQAPQTTIDFFEGLNQLEIQPIAMQQPSSQESNCSRQRGFLSIKHSKSVTQAFNPQFLHETLNKELLKDNEELQLKRQLSCKEKAIKRYQFHLQKYRSQNVKYQASILQLQSKIRKYELQLIQLNELLNSLKFEHQLQKLQENSHLADGYEEKEDSNHSSIDYLIEKEITLKLKEESLNCKIEEIIKHVMHLNQFKTESTLNQSNLILSTSITAPIEPQPIQLNPQPL